MKSHTKEEIQKALKEKKEVWKLDTGNDGEDDILIGNYDDVLFDILSYHDLDVLPDYWSLEKVDYEI